MIGKVYVSVTSAVDLSPTTIQIAFDMITNNGFRREFLGCAVHCDCLGRDHARTYQATPRRRLKVISP